MTMFRIAPAGREMTKDELHREIARIVMERIDQRSPLKLIVLLTVSTWLPWSKALSRWVVEELKRWGIEIEWREDRI